MIWANRRIYAKKTAETLKISWECVAFIIHMLDIRKLFAKWAPNCLNVLWRLHGKFLSTSDGEQQVYRLNL
jgi:hypothetical protein